MKNRLYAFNVILAILWLSVIAIIHPAQGQLLLPTPRQLPFVPTPGLSPSSPSVPTPGESPSFLTPRQRPSPSSESEKTLMAFLRDFDQSKSTRVLVSFQNLSDMGSPQAIVYLLGPKWCGSGGCNTLILAQNDIKYQDHPTPYSNLRRKIAWLARHRCLGPGRRYSARLSGRTRL